MKIYVSLEGKCIFCNLEYYINGEIDCNQIPNFNKEMLIDIREGENPDIDFSFLSNEEYPRCPKCKNKLIIKKTNYIEELT